MIKSHNNIGVRLLLYEKILKLTRTYKAHKLTLFQGLNLTDLGILVPSSIASRTPRPLRCYPSVNLGEQREECKKSLLKTT